MTCSMPEQDGVTPIIFGGYISNCYLIRTGTGFVLVDTASRSKRGRIERALADAGCVAPCAPAMPSDPGPPSTRSPQRTLPLRLIILTHGDFDHSGAASALRRRFGAPIAMHAADVPMVESGDMFINRKSGGRLMRAVVNRLFRIERFTPDERVGDGRDLGRFGLHARVLHLPGHSPGSIGILTRSGAFFCGDLFENRKRPRLNPILDDPAVARASVAALRQVRDRIRVVYPGHGRPFPAGELAELK